METEPSDRPESEEEINDSTVYPCDMAKHVHIQVKGLETPVRIRADDFRKEGAVYQVMKDGKSIGEFKDTEVLGWWIQDPDELGQRGRG